MNDRPRHGGEPLVWDLPLRIFHWGLVVLLAAAWVTQAAGTAWMRLHLWTGYALAVLVVFRVAWGFVGPRHARFGQFVAGPAAVARYVSAWLAGRPPEAAGHNPAGGWSVLLMLGLVLGQVATGMLNSDDALYAGPWHYAVPERLADAAHELHDDLFDVLLAVAAVHVAAVLAYRWRLGVDLVTPMVTGRRRGPGPGIAGSRLLRAALVLLGAIACVAAVVGLAPPPDPADLGIY